MGAALGLGKETRFRSKQTLCQNDKIFSTFFGRYAKGNLKMDEPEVPSSASGELVLPSQVVI